MKSTIQLTLALSLTLTVGCFSESKPAAPRTVTPGFESPEGLTRMLEERWSLEDIHAFCIPERRHNFYKQLLVTTAPNWWEGELYRNAETGFDQISWWADVKDGRAFVYCLEVRRGEDNWALEIGTPESVLKPPVVTPDPSADRFFGNRSRDDLLNLQKQLPR